MYKIACIVPTYNGCKDFIRLYNSLCIQDLDFDLIVIDSSSKDGTIDFLVEKSIKHIVIPTSEFNHGGTRMKVIVDNPDYDIYIYLTQDAYLSHERSLSEMIVFFNDEKVGAVCGRQLPHVDANKFAAHARIFNYPVESLIKDKNDISKLGIKVPFISNSFSAYRKEALIEVGGFPDNVILSEDMYVAAKMVLNDWKIAYSGNATVYHSHNYGLLEEWRRYFDIGAFHSQNAWIQNNFGGTGGEGIQFVKSEIKYLNGSIEKQFLSILRNLGKLFFYKIGKKEKHIPTCIKKKLSMHKSYWKN